MFRRASTSHPVVYAPLDRSLALSPFCLFLRALFLAAFLRRQPLFFFLFFFSSVLAVGHRVVTCRDLFQRTLSRLRLLLRRRCRVEILFHLNDFTEVSNTFLKSRTFYLNFTLILIKSWKFRKHEVKGNNYASLKMFSNFSFDNTPDSGNRNHN